jgi:hypothetical protein
MFIPLRYVLAWAVEAAVRLKVAAKAAAFMKANPFMIVSSEVVLHLMGGTVAERA